MACPSIAGRPLQRGPCGPGARRPAAWPGSRSGLSRNPGREGWGRRLRSAAEGFDIDCRPARVPQFVPAVVFRRGDRLRAGGTGLGPHGRQSSRAVLCAQGRAGASARGHGVLGRVPRRVARQPAGKPLRGVESVALGEIRGATGDGASEGITGGPAYVVRCEDAGGDRHEDRQTGRSDSGTRATGWQPSGCPHGQRLATLRHGWGRDDLRSTAGGFAPHVGPDARCAASTGVPRCAARVHSESAMGAHSSECEGEGSGRDGVPREAPPESHQVEAPPPRTRRRNQERPVREVAMEPRTGKPEHEAVGSGPAPAEQLRRGGSQRGSCQPRTGGSRGVLGCPDGTARHRSGEHHSRQGSRKDQ